MQYDYSLRRVMRALTALARKDAWEVSRCTVNPPYPGAALKHSVLALCGVVAALATTAAPPLVPPASALPGHVCFWPEPGETGAGGGWCYNPADGGFAVPPDRVLRHAKSFSSQVDRTVYALHFPRQGPCLQRTIWGGDYSGNWEWWDKLDAVDTTPHADCEPG